MDDLTTAVDAARERIDPAWDVARTRKAGEAFRARRRRRARNRIALGITVPLTALLVVLGLRMPPSAVRSTRHVATAHLAVRGSEANTATSPLRFWDGSTATPVDSLAHLRASEVSPSRIAIDVDRGSGRFVVTPNRREREFVVHTQGVTVRVLGTAFTVGVEGERARVSVDHGRVSVEWNGGRALLTDGEAGLFPPATGVPTETAIESDEPPADVAPEPTSNTPRPDANWRRLAESGDFGEAFEALSTSVVRDRPEELLLAADAARLSSHPREALTYYQRVVRDHASDPRAPLAAFTMGRVLLTQLGRPRDAANAFARARALAGSGSLAEDALAREVEARSSAGDTERARTLAEEYIRRYPAGQRIRAVRRFGALP